MIRLTHWRTWADVGLLSAFAFSVSVFVPGTVEGIARSLGTSADVLVGSLVGVALASLVVSLVVMSPEDDVAEDSR